MIIFCDINKFELQQPVYAINTDTNECLLLETTDMDNLGHVISRISYEQKIPHIVLGGGNENFLHKFVDDIYTVNALMYNSNNPIKISIIEGE